MKRLSLNLLVALICTLVFYYSNAQNTTQSIPDSGNVILPLKQTKVLIDKSEAVSLNDGKESYNTIIEFVDPKENNISTKQDSLEKQLDITKSMVDSYKLLYVNQKESNSSILGTVYWALGGIATVLLFLMGSNWFFNVKKVKDILSENEKKLKGIKEEISTSLANSNKDDIDSLKKTNKSDIDKISKDFKEKLDRLIENINDNTINLMDKTNSLDKLIYQFKTDINETNSEFRNEIRKQFNNNRTEIDNKYNDLLKSYSNNLDSKIENYYKKTNDSINKNTSKIISNRASIKESKEKIEEKINFASNRLERNLSETNYEIYINNKEYGIAMFYLIRRLVLDNIVNYHWSFKYTGRDLLELLPKLDSISKDDFNSILEGLKPYSKDNPQLTSQIKEKLMELKDKGQVLEF